MVDTALAARTLGGSGIGVSAVSYGCMSLSGIYGATDDASGIAVIHEALDLGVTMLDSSDMYGAGHNEELLGKALKGRRDGVIVATKFGNLGGGRAGGKVADGRPEFVIESCEASLKRLGIDTIDLYYQHRIDADVPTEDTVGAMAKLVEQGKVRALGLSEARPDRIRRAHAVHPIAAVQNEYSLMYRAEGEETRRTTRELGISFVAYAPLGRGLLTGQVESPDTMGETDTRRRHPRFAPDNMAHNLELVRKIEAIAKRKGCTVGQLTLAWLLAQGDDLVAIPGTKRKERLRENVGALDVVLNEAERREIDDAVPVGAAAGTRYPEAQMKSVYL